MMTTCNDTSTGAAAATAHAVDPTPAPTTNPMPAPIANPTPAPTAEPTPAPTANPTPVPTPYPGKRHCKRASVESVSVRPLEHTWDCGRSLHHTLLAETRVQTAAGSSCEGTVCPLWHPVAAGCLAGFAGDPCAACTGADAYSPG
jgi:hypothetical protein